VDVRIWNRARLVGLCLAGALALGLAAEASWPAAVAEAAQGLTRVRLGIINVSSDAGFLIAMDQGYFREQGIEIDSSPFDSAARMVAPLGAGQLDAGGGSHSAGLYNAAARGIGIKIVADKGSSPPGFGFQGLLFRRDLAESGRLRTPADLRGMRVAVPARGITPEAALAAWLRQSGLTLDDVEIAEMGFPDHPTALASRAIDASMTIEPFIVRALDLGAATIYQRTDELFPGYQIAEVLYSSQFASEQPDAARRFMSAYLRALRFYNDGFVRGDQARRQEAIASLVRHTGVTDPALYDRMIMPGLDPDGRMSVESLKSDQEFWLQRGIQQSRVDIDALVDYTFADAAVQTLGPYR
jgi:NitT/TauT family transport system substrate-binding protein